MNDQPKEERQPVDERLKQVPFSPGVYIWKDANGQILYVGKSKSLRDRMRSYFAKGLNAKTQAMVSQIADFDIILTTSELEALLLEMNLIKEHRPKYNILLRDDKSYPYIKVTVQEDWPRIFSTRRVIDDGSKYYGPYGSAGAVREVLRQLNQLFAFRPPFDCKDEKFNRHRKLGKPCMYFDIKRCLGPCVPGVVSQEEYRATINAVCAFLEGKSEQIVRDFQRKMVEASTNMEFERAAYLRDQIKNIEQIVENQQVLRNDDTNQDAIALATDSGIAVAQILYVRSGKLIGSEPFVLQNAEGESDSQLLTSFVTQFYESAAQIPQEILVSTELVDNDVIAEWLNRVSDHRVKLSVPKRGQKRQLVDLAAQNARQKVDELRVAWLTSEQRATASLTQIRDLIGMEELPMRIECYDISNTQGTNSVGAMIVFERGNPNKSQYRKFKIKSVEGANDVASIREIVERRFKRAQEIQAHGDEPLTDKTAAEQAKWATLPDLVLIDGGAGQLNAAVEVLQSLGFGHLPIAGVVKGVNRDRFDLLLPGASSLIVLERNSPALFLVQQIDEEADRFAKQYHRTVRSKGATKSMLDEIPGIGATRRKALLKQFGSLDRIRSASVEELSAVPGMNRTAAESLKARL